MRSTSSLRSATALSFFRRLSVFGFALLIALTARAVIDPALQMQTGNPSGATADANNHAHYLITRPQYAMDYNDTTHQANWVAWDYTSADSGTAGRSSVFFQDTTLPPGFYQVLTTDYSGSGYDRGHMSPSADRTATRADNDATFFMSNMIPQTPDNNQGVWASFENYTRSLAAAGNEILIISGPSLFGGSTIASGVAIPGYTWKIAVVVPLGASTASSRITASTRVITIKIPNIAGVRNNPWQQYSNFSPATIEADTGFHFFTDLPLAVADILRNAVDGQSATGAPSIVVPPVAQSATVGGSATFSVTASGDAPLSYQWLKEDVEIPGAIGTTLTLNNVQASDVATYTVTVTNPVGSVTSNGAALVVAGLPPTITSQPAAHTSGAGSSVSLSVTAGGSAPFTYQWRKAGVNLADGGNVAGSATPTLTLTNVQSGDVASYDVVVTNNVSFITSNAASLAVTPAAPTITSQPANRSLAPGSTTVFSVSAVGTAPLSYQWRKGGVAIAGNASATTANLTVANITFTDAGSYDVVVTNVVGSIPSSAASLTISSASTTQVFYTGGTYTQDFDTLPSSGTFTFAGPGPFYAAATSVGGLGVNATSMGGWSFAKVVPTTGVLSTGNELFNFGTGSSGTGSMYSFGVAGAGPLTDRAFGGLLSGTTASNWGVAIVNNTGQTITQFTISYTGEQWRYGGTAAGPDRILFEYQVGGSDIVTGTFTGVSTLDFASLLTAGTTGAKDGNAPANRAARTATITVPAWAAGQTLVLRWRDSDVSGADDGLSIDEFSFSTAVTGPVGPSVASTAPANAATNAALNSTIAVTFDQPVNASGSWFAINSASRGAISASVTASADFKTYTLTPPSNFDFSENISVTVFASGVTSRSTGLHPAANYSFSFVTAAPVAPGITTQPAPQTVAAGANASFTVGASGTAPFTYQWRKGGSAIAGNPTSGSATLVLTNAQAADIGSYDVVISNGVGSPVTSTAALLSVNPAAPTIGTQPVAQNVAAGGTVTLSVTATGTAPFTYQWRKGGVALSDSATVSGSAGATLTLSNVTVLNSGSYDVVISNGVGSPATSTAVTVIVIVPPSILNYAGGTYAQNFDTLPNTGTFTFVGAGPFSFDANPGVNATAMAGWSFAKNTGSGANALFKFDDGGSTSGGVNSYGTSGATDRALGSVGSGTMASRVGVTLVNTTGVTITYVTVNYTGEQWRHGGAATPNKFAFSYAVGATDISTGTFTNLTALDFTAPVTTATGSALDGNAIANRVPNITATITGLNWTPGQTLVLRWTDVDDTGSDDGLAIDDFSITNAPPVPAITTQPVAQTVPAFSPASFTVAAKSTTPQTYQWRKNGADITGNASATTPTLSLLSASAADAGSYDCVVTNTYGSTPSNPATLTITKIAGGIALDVVTATYDGTPKSATAITTPVGLGVTFTYDGNATAPTNAGAYGVVATIADANYTGSATGTFTISPAAATVTLGNLSLVYNGAPQAATATTIPANLPVAFTYDGSATLPTNAGSYAVVATVTDPNYTGSASGTLTIAKAGAGVALSNLSQVYNTATHVVTVVTTPAGLPVVATYESGSALPVNVGNYAVVATVDHPNYFGSATGTLAITKATAPIALSGLSVVYDGSAKAAVATTTPTGLNVVLTYDGSATAPTNAGTYAVAATINEANYFGSATGTLTIARAPATIAFTNTTQTYDGAAKSVTVTTTPSSLATAVTYGGSATLPTNAATYAVAATITDPNYSGTATGSLTIDKAVAPVVLSNLAQTYDGTPKSAAAGTTPAGLTVNFTYNSSATAPSAAGSYAVVATIADTNYRGSASGTLVIAPASATIAFSNLTQVYDGTPKAVTATTTPAGLTTSITYNGNATAPTIPGTYAVVATITDPNYTATASGNLVITITALVRHAPSLDGDLDGSLQVLTGENLSLNGNALVSGDILAPGTPTVRLNGHPTFVGTKDGTGSVSPANYQLTLNGNAVLRYLVRRTDPIALPTVGAPPAPAGTRDLEITKAGQSLGTLATLRNVTINDKAGDVALPAGTYGTLTADGSTAFVLGVAGATTPSVYNLQGLKMDGKSQLKIVGPVVIVLARNGSLDGEVVCTGSPAWLTLGVASGGVTLNGNVSFRGTIVAPNGTVVINGNASLTGSVIADRLTINGNGLLKQGTP